MTKKSCNSGFQVVEMQVLDYFTNSVYTLGLYPTEQGYITAIQIVVNCH
jgi:hypothetical protein